MSVEAAQNATGHELTLLLEFPFRQTASHQLAASLNKVIAQLPLLAPTLTAWQATTAAVATCYINTAMQADLLNNFAQLSTVITAIATKQLDAVIDGDIEFSRLRNVAVHRGASAGANADFHYVVRTDVEAGGDAELQRWYDDEHMAMLAAVPGTVQARRFVSLDATPRYYACYDLVAPDVLTSAAWLKVRQTPWSERVRPTFRNTRRVISRKINLFNSAVDS